MRKIILLSALLAYCIQLCCAQPGKPDSSFGINGTVTTNIQSLHGLTQYKCVVVQPDGKLVAAGSTNVNSYYSLVVARYNLDGSLDKSFSHDGKVMEDSFTANAIAIQKDGKIVVAGSGVARLNIDGSLDASFSGGKVAIPSFNFSSLAIQKDGRIVVAGSITNPDDESLNEDFALARFNTDGTLDTTFSEDGKLVTNVFRNDHANCVVIQADGKILAGGNSYEDYKESFNYLKLVRYTKDGILDTSFNKNGIVQEEKGEEQVSITSLVLQKDGKIVGAEGTTLGRYNYDGSLDKNFAAAGKLETPLGGLSSVDIQGDGKLLAAGFEPNGSTFAVARYYTDGVLDTGFSKDGIEETKISQRPGAISSIAIDNSKLYLAGFDIYSPYVEGGSGVIARYIQATDLDSSYGNNGIVKTDFGSNRGSTNFTGTAIQADGKIVVVGTTSNDTITNVAIARYNTHGALDTTFSNDGKQITSFDTTTDCNVRSVAIQNDGKILVAGVITTGYLNQSVALIRYNPDGSLDTTFGKGGKKTNNFRVGGYVQASEVMIQKDGKIVVAGNIDDDLAAIRYNIDGSLDSTFNGDGKVTTGLNSFARGYSGAIQSDGKILVAGTSGINETGEAPHFTIVRYNTNGNLDKSFSNDGIQTTAFAYNDYARSIALQADDKILVAGYSYYQPNYKDEYILVRYNTDGTIDSSFGNNGKQVSYTSYTEALATSVRVQNNGNILVGGYVVKDGKYDLGFTNYYRNGNVNPNFDSDPRVTADASFDPFKKLAIGNDRFYFVGTTSSQFGVLSGFLLDNQSQTPPAVSLITPANNATYTAAVNGAKIKLRATATDADGAISKVEFYKGNTLIHTVHESPYNYLWVDVPIGNYQLTARATDDSGNVTTSAVVNISVVLNKAPTVNITSPVNGASYTSRATIILGADAKDDDGKIRKVEFYNGNTLIGTEENAPYIRNWNHVPVGDYIITAKATDNSGGSTISAPVHVSVLPANFLTVNITNPVNNAVYVAAAGGATITLSADAKGPNGIVKTDFYSGSTLIFTDYVFPYSNKWRNVPPGNYSITAKTTDASGNVATSVPIQIFVEKAPCTFASQPTFGFNFNGTSVANINNGSPDPGESASLVVSNGEQYTTSAHFNSSSSNLYDISYVSGGSSLLFNGYPVSNVVITADQLTATAGTYTISLANPGIEGTLKQTITPFKDVNNNGKLDADDCAGDPIVFTYTVSPKPTFGFTFAGTNLQGSINLANINNGIPDPGESAGVKICESGHYITSAHFYSNPSNLYKIIVNTTGAGLLVDNQKQAGDRTVTAAQLTAEEGFHSISLANPNVSTTVVETITPFTDLNNNGVFDPGDVAGDPIIITYALIHKLTWYRDVDGDQHASEVTISCGTTPDPGYTLTVLPVDDCDDNDPTPCPDNNITVNITSPLNGANFTELATIHLSADASSRNGSIKQVDFYERGRLILSEQPPFHKLWYKVPAGEYFINAKATDNNGKSTFSPTIHIMVLLSNNLTVNLASPVNGATFNAPANIILTADVKGPNDIIKTDFYNGSSLIFTENVYPYSNKWRNVPAGNYSITAKATDSKGNVATSVPLAITVNTSASPVSMGRSSLNVKTGNTDAESLHVAPNPAHNILNIHATGLLSSKQLIVSVISASGVIMQTKQFSNATRSGQTIQLNVSSLVSGLYALKLVSGDKIMYKRFVKL